VKSLLKLNLDDNGGSDLSEKDWKIVKESCDFIDGALVRKEGKALVHCVAGINRSATIVIAWLMRANKWSLLSALTYVKRKRDSIYPAAYLGQLVEWEQRLSKELTTEGEELLDGDKSNNKLDHSMREFVGEIALLANTEDWIGSATSENNCTS